ncbi:MAG: hypothetical protein HC904_04795 [Blastochloris sp.]|nr:hypothetical protein [Blastochloris sp.]
MVRFDLGRVENDLVFGKGTLFLVFISEYVQSSDGKVITLVGLREVDGDGSLKQGNITPLMMLKGNTDATVYEFLAFGNRILGPAYFKNNLIKVP